MGPKRVLFEQTRALDAERVGDVIVIIHELVTRGMTMNIGTHDIAFAREIAGRVIFMDTGRIVEERPPQDLLGRPRRERTRSSLARVA